MNINNSVRNTILSQKH